MTQKYIIANYAHGKTMLEISDESVEAGVKAGELMNVGGEIYAETDPEANKAQEYATRDMTASRKDMKPKKAPAKKKKASTRSKE